MTLCSPSRANTCKGEQHTAACQAREALAKRLLTWLKDPLEAELRARICTEKGRALDTFEAMALFLRWHGADLTTTFQLDPSERGILTHRMTPDTGGWIRALDFAMSLLHEEMVNAPYEKQQTRLSE
jgi:hypothetical protein